MRAEQMNLGYIGLGNMGGALASRLQLSRELIVFDRDPAVTERLVALGAQPAREAAELAAGCEVVLLCLPTSDHVHTVLFGEGGIAEVLRPGTIVIDQTTGDPIATRAMAQRLRQQDVQMIDAPVSGGITAAQAGTIAIMVGADPGQFETVQPILADISPNIFHAGGVGNGQVIKLVNNLLSHAQRLLSLEALALADKNGVNSRTAHEILMASGGRNAYLEKSFGPRVMLGNLSPGFTLGLAHKDVRLATDLARVSGVPSLFGGIARELYQLCIAENGAEAQVDTAALVIDRWAKTRVVPQDGETAG
ncbi:NAD(P)-dependent oxidoreductase [Arthrobacter bambusae]|nr:NAD(P)-dependent oxidoreductase [Arthrobacter bambusae]